MKFILIILDGFGLREEEEGNAFALAKTPHLDKLLNKNPISSIQTSGKYVGLPDGIMGNSEVGHMNIGAGRIVKQDLVRINDDIKSNDLVNNNQFSKLIEHVSKNNSNLHLFGLLSDGGVHSHIDHFLYILNAAKEKGLNNIYIHAFTDGRDTSPTSGINYIKKLQLYLDNLGVGEIASICGRYYAMDRDNRWERVDKAYRMLVNGEGEKFSTAEEAVEHSYKYNITDEFILPKVISDSPSINDGDAVLTMNFRADRMRQLSKVFTDKSFNEFESKNLDIYYTSMTKYQDSFTFPVLYPPISLSNIFPEILSKHGYKQLRIAETEKYAHVTYFFNGGDENQFPGEDRILVPSPKPVSHLSF